jgi:signal transduction histidine kinase/DNA-binding NarL/FixJ family response regulator
MPVLVLSKTVTQTFPSQELSQMPARIQILGWANRPLQRESVWNVLEEEPDFFQITKVTSLTKLKSQLLDHKCDLILADFSRLGFENLTLLDLPQVKDSRIPVVIIASVVSTEVAVEAIKRGAVDCIIKSPSHIRRLPDTLRTLVQEKQEQEAERKDSLEKLELAYEQAQTHAWELQVEMNERKRAEEALLRSVKRLRNLHEIDRDILVARSPAAIVETTLKRLRHLVSCQWAGVALFDFETQEAVIFATDADEEDSMALTGLRHPFGPGRLARLRQGKIVIVEDVPAVTPPESLVQRLIVEGFRSCLQVPLNVQDELLGVVNLAAKLPNAFDSERVEVAVEVAHLLAVALQQANLFEQISTARERLEALSRQLLTAQEAERRHIARELHDEIGQSLSMVKIDLQTLQKLPQAATLASHLSDSVEIVERALQLVRDLSVELRPSLLDDLGLVPALRWFLDRLAQRGGFTARLLDPPLEARLAPELEIACYRIAQEALTNILRYAQAKQVEVELQQREAELRLTIRDDGLGFDVSEALKRAMHGTSLGLLSLFSTPPIGLKQ